MTFTSNRSMTDRRTLLRASVALGGAAFLGGCGSEAGSPSTAGKPTAGKPSGRTPSTVQRGQLKVPGAGLYYEVRGSGPTLLLIHGGVGDAGVFTGIAPLLAGQYKVVTYDRRGNSRSKLDGPPTQLRLDQQADDAARLLDRFADEPPYVFGTSGGGVVALEIAARYGARLRGVVAHEPPVSEVLPDAARWRKAYEHAYRTYRRRGVAEGFAEFMRIDPGEEDPKSEGDWADPGFGRRIEPNKEFLLAYEMLPFTRYRPKTDALKKMGGSLVIGVAHYKAPMMTRVVRTLAGRLGTAVVEFPGDHTGYMPRSREFADRLREVLT